HVIPDAPPQPIDAAAPPPIDAAVAVDARRAPITPDPRDAAFEALLRDAEAARSAPSPVDRLAKAQLACEANPRDVRAACSFGDALISTANVDRGCALLRQLARYAPAVARVKAVCTAP